MGWQHVNAYTAIVCHETTRNPARGPARKIYVPAHGNSGRPVKSSGLMGRAAYMNARARPGRHNLKL